MASFSEVLLGLAYHPLVQTLKDGNRVYREKLRKALAWDNSFILYGAKTMHRGSISIN